MPISMYQASVPVFQKMLANLDMILDKAAADAASRKIDPQVFLQARLAPDMFALTRQVQTATDFAKGTPSRLAGVDIPKYEDNESSFLDLKSRIDRTLQYLSGFKPAQFDGAEQRSISFKAGSVDLLFNGLDYLTLFALPNFFFHYTTAYSILRHNGVVLGKGDFISGRRS